MPEYLYKALEDDGTLTSGVVQGASEQDVARLMQRNGRVLLSAELRGVTGKGGSAPLTAEHATTGDAGTRFSWLQFRKAKLRKIDVLRFADALAELLASGIRIDRALLLQERTEKHPALVQSIATLRQRVSEGAALSEALADQPAIYPSILIALVAAAEQSGQVAAVLGRYAEDLRDEVALEQDLQKALTYPAILATVGVLAIFAVFNFVIPQFETVFEDAGDSLPWLTQWVIAIAGVVQAWGAPMLAAALVLFFTVRALLQTADIKRRTDTVLSKLPVFGAKLVARDLSVYLNTAGAALGNGVRLLQALELALPTVRNHGTATALQKIINRVRGGESLGQCLVNVSWFPPLAMQMVAVGEETGTLAQALMRAGRRLGEDTRQFYQRIVVVVEPVLIVVLGAVIGLVIVALLQGIMSVNSVPMG